MLEWNLLDDNQLSQYIHLNLTLDEQAERIITLDNDVILIDDVLENERENARFSYDWSRMSINSISKFISFNITLLDQAKDIYTNNLGKMLKTDDVKVLMHETVDKFSGLTDLTDLVDDVVFIIAKHLNYDGIVSMCLTSYQFVNLCKSKIFWLNYLKDIHEIMNVYDLDIDLLKEGVQFIERCVYDWGCKWVNGFHWIENPGMYAFVTKLSSPQNDINFEDFVNLQHLFLAERYINYQDLEIDFSKLTNLHTLKFGEYNQVLNLDHLINLHILN